MSVIKPYASTVLVEWVDPERAYCGWAATHHNSFWLDAGPAADSGRSWIGIGEQVDADSVRHVGLAPTREGASTVVAEEGAGPLPGGWVGWLGYEPAAARAGAPTSPHAGTGDRWMQVRAVVVFDHGARTVTVHAPASDLPAVCSAVAAAPPPDPVPDPPSLAVRARHRAAEYATLIAQCRDEIRRGNAYQLCLTTRFDLDGRVDALDAYRRLRQSVSAHHGGLVRFGDQYLLSASPEQFLDVAGGRVRTQPIKGTRTRDPDPRKDAALSAELAADVKERAENVMIVDLMRNDLSRVCTTGSVTVERLFAVESYPAVHQLVSTISGTLRPNVDVGALLDATFPAGSMTGAPKLSAMTILERIEGGPRGVFAGAFGWVGSDGSLDLAMVIRSIVIAGDRAYVGAGGGITWLSDAAFEVAEVALKARGPLGAVGAAPPPEWDEAATAG